MTLLCSAALFASKEHSLTRCAGGGGGIPLSGISTSVSPQTSLVKTSGLIKEFALNENTNHLIYRSDKSEFIFKDLETSLERSIGIFPLSLSRVVDPDKSYLSTENADAVYMTPLAKKEWHKISHLSSLRYQPLYWNQGTLYSIAEERKLSSDELIIHAAKYMADQDTVHECQLIISLRDWEPGMMSGSEYPYVGLYFQKHTKDGYRFKTYELNMNTCYVELKQLYEDPIPGRVTSVSRYSNGGNVIQIDHPTKNLLWDRGENECVFYNLEGRKAYPLKGHYPYVATWKEGEGLGMINAQNSDAVAWKELGDFPVFAENLWLTENGKDLFVAVQPSRRAHGRVLVRVEVSGISY